MKFKFKILLFFVLAITVSSCQNDFLDERSVLVDVTLDQLYYNYPYMQGVVWNTYSYLPNGFSYAYQDAATDNAEATNELSPLQKFNNGTWDQFTNPDDVWAHYFSGIRQANLYLKNRSKTSIDYIKNGIIGQDSTVYINAKNNLVFMHGEVLFLKAYFYFELVKRYGGVPIMEEPLDFANSSALKNIKRNSLSECVSYIINLCDSAKLYIPADLSPYAWYQDGRVTQGAMLALKSRVLLYAASPLYTDNGSTTKWEDAAKAAYEVINTNSYKLADSYAQLFGSNNNSTSEVIFKQRNYGSLNYLEFDNFPKVFDGSNGNSITPTQNFVDAFEVLTKDASGSITGSIPFDWNNPVHSANPYLNRDPRFYATVVYNGEVYKGITIQTYAGGNSGQPILGATKTGYYLAKWIDPAIDLVNNTSSNHTWIYFRYGEVLLNYAEAMFNAFGATADPNGYGMSALQAINKVRTRAGMPNLSDIDLTQLRIENERNVELSFEDQRFWDVRRWEKGDYFNRTVNKISIVKSGTDLEPVYTFNVKPLENRVFETKMYFYPIPQSEIIKTGWSQNALWSN